MPKCYLCYREAEIGTENNTGARIVKCEKCGKYLISEQMAEEDYPMIREEDKPYLSSYAKAYAKENGKPLRISYEEYHVILNKAKACVERSTADNRTLASRCS